MIPNIQSYIEKQYNKKREIIICPNRVVAIWEFIAYHDAFSLKVKSKDHTWIIKVIDKLKEVRFQPKICLEEFQQKVKLKRTFVARNLLDSLDIRIQIYVCTEPTFFRNKNLYSL